MRVRTACLDRGLLWVIDDVTGGLFSVDETTFETECALDYKKLFPNGKTEILSLFQWKEDYIVIIPFEVDRSWILYNKVTGGIEYRRVVERKCQEILIASDENRNQLYFFPRYVQDPILIVDLKTLTCLQFIENWHAGVPDVCCETAWKGAYNGQYVFFPIKNTRCLVRMCCETRKVDVLKLGIPENVIDVDYAFEELWVIPIRGNRLYQINENGGIINSVELLVSDDIDLIPDFARIVVQKRYIFLLPYFREGIYIYDKLSEKIHIIRGENKILKEKKFDLIYWEYYVRNNRICFLPLRDDCVEIDLDTLVYDKKKLSYPAIWSDEERIKKCVFSHLSKDNLTLEEIDVCDLNVFLEYMQSVRNIEKSLNGCIGEKIWDIMRHLNFPL